MNLRRWTKKWCLKDSPGVQWLRLYASTAGGTGSILGQGNKIPHAAQHDQRKNKMKCMIAR